MELGIEKADLEELVEAGGEALAAAVRQRVESLRTHPDRVLGLSTKAVTDAAEELARRIREEGHVMTTAELNQCIGNLEKLAGISETRKQEIKESAHADGDAPTGTLMLQDYRDNRLTLITVGPKHPCRVGLPTKFTASESPEARRQRTTDLLNQYFPRDPETGAILNMAEHIAQDVTFLEPPFNTWS